MEESEANRQKEATVDGLESRKHKDATTNGDFILFILSSLLFWGMRNENRP